MSPALVLPAPIVGALPFSTGFGEDAEMIRNRFIEAMDHYWELPVTRRSLSTHNRFYQLLKEWQDSRGPTSSVTQLAMHPAYQQIIGIGPDALPFILRELERTPDHWFWALNAITGLDPVRVEDRGRLRKMAAAWIRWAKDEGYKW